MWIETKNKLPEFNKWVLCYCRIYGYYIGSYKQIDDTNWGNWHDGKELGVLPPVLWQYMEEIPMNHLNPNDRSYCTVNTTTPVRPAHAPTLAQVEEVFIRQGKSKEEAAKFYHYYEGLAWMKGITPIRNWQAFANMWQAGRFDNKGTTQQGMSDKDRKTIFGE